MKAFSRLPLQNTFWNNLITLHKVMPVPVSTTLRPVEIRRFLRTTRESRKADY